MKIYGKNEPNTSVRIPETIRQNAIFKQEFSVQQNLYIYNE